MGKAATKASSPLWPKGASFWRRSGVLAAAGLMLSCATSSARPKRDPNATSASPGSQQPPKPSADSNPAAQSKIAQLREQAQESSAQLHQTRKLPLPKRYSIQLSSPVKLRQLVSEDFKRETPPQQEASISASFSMLGFLPEDVSFFEAYGKFSEEGVQGLYRPGERSLWIRDDLGTMQRDYVVSHEIVHLMQDEAFDLRKIKSKNRRCLDREFALAMLIEGDAMVASSQLWWPEDELKSDRWLARRDAFLMVNLASSSGSDHRLRYFQRIFSFIYGFGGATVLEQLHKGGWASVDKMYKDPPDSSNQMLHFERLQDDVQPRLVSWKPKPKDRPCKNPRIVSNHGLGELLWLSLLLEDHDLDQALATTKAWLGDRVVVLECQTRQPYRLALAGIYFENQSSAANFKQAIDGFYQSHIKRSYRSWNNDNFVYLALWSSNAPRISASSALDSKLKMAWIAFVTQPFDPKSCSDPPEPTSAGG